MKKNERMLPRITSQWSERSNANEYEFAWFLSCEFARHTLPRMLANHPEHEDWNLKRFHFFLFSLFV